ncbi:hypothetical protein Tco_1478490, partial [Tanacetum coccineum]
FGPPESTPVIDESTLLVSPLPDSKEISLREVERFDLFFSLTQSSEKKKGDGDPFFWFSSSCCILTYGGDVLLLPSSPQIRTPFDLEDLRACF